MKKALSETRSSFFSIRKRLAMLSFPHALGGTGSRKAFFESECRTKLPINLLSVAQCGNPDLDLHTGSPTQSFGDDGQQLRRAGFTLIEMVMVILITALLSVSGIHIMQFAIQHTFFLPNQVQADLLVAEALETMVEGDSNTVRGLRFCKAVTALDPYQVNVTDQDGVALQFRLDTVSHKLYRKIGAASETLVPYYMPTSVDFTGNGTLDSLFTYYNSAYPEVETADPALVRRIRIDLKAQQGAGSVDSFEGRSKQSTSIEVNKYV